MTSLILFQVFIEEQIQEKLRTYVELIYAGLFIYGPPLDVSPVHYRVLCEHL